MKTLVAFALLTFAFAAHAESSFNDVMQVLYDRDQAVLDGTQAQSEYSVYQQGRIPQYEVSFGSIFQFGSTALENAAKRTMKDKSDYFDRLPKLLHPNGVCVIGQWEMNEASPFTGAFAANTKNLFIGRVSVAMGNTKAGANRGFGLAGKLFPTQDPNAVVATENFFSVDVLMGTKTPRYLDTATTNEPELGFDIWVLRLGLKIASALSKADENPSFRPVRNLASMGVPAGAPVKLPHWLRFSSAQGTIKNNETDFRREVLQAVKDNRELVFNVEASDSTKDRSAKTGWTPIGKIRISEAVVSYGCDRRLHFAHPRSK